MKKNILSPLVMIFFLAVLAVTNSNAAVVFESAWGTLGTLTGQFDTPESVAVDKLGNVYVGDIASAVPGNISDRIQIFNSNGTSITAFGTTGSSLTVAPLPQFNTIKGVAVDSKRNFYAIEDNNDRVQKFNSNCAMITNWGVNGTGNGSFAYPYGIAVYSTSASSTTTTGSSATCLTTTSTEIVTENVYVSDTYNFRVQRFNTSTTYTTTTKVTAGTTTVTNTVTDTGGTFATVWGQGPLAGAKSGNGEFNYAWGIAVDNSGATTYVYVADQKNHRIQKFNKDGVFILAWGSQGTANGQFKNPRGVAVDSSGNVFITDTDNNRVQKFNTNGTFLTSWGSAGTGNGQFDTPIGIAVSSAGKIYVADKNNHRIQKFYETPDVPPVPPVPAGPQILTIVGGVKGYVNPSLGEICDIKYQAGFAGAVTISIFSSSGIMVRKITGLTSDGSTVSTYHYDCKDDTGGSLSTGIYTVKIDGPTLSLVRKFAIAR